MVATAAQPSALFLPSMAPVMALYVDCRMESSCCGWGRGAADIEALGAADIEALLE